MASFLPSSIQKRLLRYALLRTGFLDEQELDLDSLDIAFGRENIVELRNVRLSVDKLASLLQLPPDIRIQAARVLRLKLNVPTDLYSTPITAEAHGLECEVFLADAAPKEPPNSSPRGGRESQRAPEHRKTHRRIGRSPPYDPGGYHDEYGLPSTRDLAQSFLMEEPAAEVEELKTRFARRQQRDMPLNDIEPEEVGTGTTPGLPGFLAGFLQSIVDRFRFDIFGVKATLSIPKHLLASDSGRAGNTSPASEAPICIVLNIGKILIGESRDRISQAATMKKHISIHELSISILGLDLRASMRSAPHTTTEVHMDHSDSAPEVMIQNVGSGRVPDLAAPSTSDPERPLRTYNDLPTPRLGTEHDGPGSTPGEVPDPFDILLGEDNQTWNVRRYESGSDASDLWSNSDPSADLTASVTADRYLAGNNEVVHGLSSPTLSLQRSIASGENVESSLPDQQQPRSIGFGGTSPPLAFAQSPTAKSGSSGASPPHLMAASQINFGADTEDPSESLYMSALGSELHDERAGALEDPLTHSVIVDTASPLASQGSPQPVPLNALSQSRIGLDVPDHTSAVSESTVAEESVQKPHQIIFIDHIDVAIQLGQSEEDAVSPAVSQRLPVRNMVASSMPQMPGAFSVYAEQSASVYFGRASTTLQPSFAVDPVNSSERQSDFKVTLHNVQMALEIGMLSEYTSIATALSKVAPAGPGKDAHESDRDDSQPKPTTTVDMRLLGVNLVDSCEDHWRNIREQGGARSEPRSSSPPSLLDFVLCNTLFTTSAKSPLAWSLALGVVSLKLEDRPILLFSDSLQESKRSLRHSDPDVSIECSGSTSITQYSVHTKQMDLEFAMDKLEAVFNNYGGLSSLLELGTSMSPSDSPHTTPSTPLKKGVRFGPDPPFEAAKSEIKVNARFGGLQAVISGRSGSIQLSTSSIKAVARSDYVAATIDRLRVHVPGARSSATSPPLDIVGTGFRFEYLFHPKDADLERLLSLLTPTKNKYENDDDILMDTLLRQRRKGAVVRLNLATLNVRVQDWKIGEEIQALAGELVSLSAVTKYLPEDERPGLLTLVRVQEGVALLPVNDTFGSAALRLDDLNVAHVGLPSLFALAIGQVQCSRENSFVLVHDLVHVPPGENLPMIMARMIGDEVDPTLRLKLYNVCLEYSVPAFLALTEFGAQVTADKVIDLAASTIVDMADLAAEATSTPSSFDSSLSKPSKKLNIDLLFHDCMIGLQPSGLESKCLLVLNDTKIATTVPPKETIQVVAELRKATIHVAARAGQMSPKDNAIKFAVPNRLADTLSQLGYVNVSSLMAARVDVTITESADKQTRSVELDVRNELLLLETCADSMATLTKIAGALAPPSPPSKEQKYRTEVMTMDEMVSSFVGDAFERPASPPSTVFDVNTTSPLGDDEFLNAGMSESLLALDQPGDDLFVENEPQGDTAESLLDEDPFEIPDNPNAAKLNNKELLKALNQQMEPNIAGGPVQIKPMLLTDDQIDKLHGESTILGAPYRWNTAKAKTIGFGPLNSKQHMPLKVRIRDVHVIWNLYDGYDWQGTREAITQAVEEVEHRAEERRLKRQTAIHGDDEESIIGDCLFNSIYIGVPTSKDVQELRRQINHGIDDTVSETESYATSGVTRPSATSGTSKQRARKGPRRLKLQRSRTHKIAFELRGLGADILVFPPGVSEVQNSIDVRVRDFEIFDNLPSSTWRKFLTSWNTEDVEREIAKPMVHLEISSVRPIVELSATELVICVTITPLRLHVDQDALDFITRFFAFKDGSGPPAVIDEAEVPFIQRLEVNTVDLNLDYKPKRVDYAGLRSGRYAEFKNFFILDAAHIKLRHAILYGIQGFEPLNDTLNDIWTPDIKANQLPKILSGLAGVSPLVSLGTGLAEVVAVPIREYRKDGRVVRSIQKGAVHLVRNTTSEIARFGVKVAVGTQNVLSGAEGLLAPGSSSAASGPSRRRSMEGWSDIDEDEEPETRKVSAYADQPLGVLQGLRSARRHLEKDLLLARDAIIAVQGEVLEGASASAAAQAVVRHAPTILLRPVIGASRAVGQTLMGVGNSIDKSNIKRVEDKYKQR